MFEEHELRDIQRIELDNARREIANLKAQLEAQHRKTWSLAMEAAANATKGFWSSGWNDTDAPKVISALPCPLIEATKDK